MSQIKEFSFNSINKIYIDEDCNIWDDDLSEGSQKNDLVRNSSLQRNMEFNSFFKYDKSYSKINLRKPSIIEEKKFLQSNNTYSLNNCINSNMNTINNQRMSLKSEVSLLLKWLVNMNKYRRYSQPSSPISFNNQNNLHSENIKEDEQVLTMRKIEPSETIQLL